jgi:hypothetical protein
VLSSVWIEGQGDPRRVSRHAWRHNATRVREQTEAYRHRRQFLSVRAQGKGLANPEVVKGCQAWVEAQKRGEHLRPRDILTAMPPPGPSSLCRLQPTKWQDIEVVTLVEIEADLRSFGRAVEQLHTVHISLKPAMVS